MSNATEPGPAAAGESAEPAQAPAAKPAARGESAPRPAGRRVSPTVLVAVAALAMFAWQWYDSRQQTGALQQELARRLAEADTRTRESRIIADEVREATREAQVKLGVLEAKLAESQSQQIALEALYQDLSRNRDEWALADIEQALLIASEQLQLAGNVRAALIALAAADARLQRMNRPQFAALRKAINRDMDRLKAVPHVDVIGVAVRLDNLIAAVDTLPLAMDVRPQQARAAAEAKDGDESTWSRLAREVWLELRQLVRVQRTDKPQEPLLAPSQAYFLRENLKLRLIGARLALVAREETSFKADLKAARESLNRYYDARNKTVAGALATLRNLHEGKISIQLPDIAASLEAVRSSKLARERAR